MGKALYLKEEVFAEFLRDIDSLRLRKMTHDQVRLMFGVLLYGSMRISEVLQITPNDLIDGKVRLKITKGGKKRCKCSEWKFHPMRLISSDKNCKKCKGLGRYRVDVNAEVLPEIYSELLELAKKKKPDERLFPITRSWAWHYADLLLGARTHTFRHTFLTWMLDSDKFNVRDIMQKARHSNLAVTTTYIESNTDLTQKKIEDNFERIV